MSQFILQVKREGDPVWVSVAEHPDPLAHRDPLKSQPDPLERAAPLQLPAEFEEGGEG